MKHGIFKVAMQFGFSCTNISWIFCIQVKHQISNYVVVGKTPWKNRAVDDWQEYLNEIDMQHFLKLQRISILGHQKVSLCELFNGPSLIWAFKATGLVMYCCWLHTTKLYTSPGLPKPSLDCRWLETHFMVSRVSFLIVSGEWTCMGMETTSWIHVPYQSTGDFKLIEPLWWYGACAVDVIWELSYV